jgi:hypothetical protein
MRRHSLCQSHCITLQLTLDRVWAQAQGPQQTQLHPGTLLQLGGLLWQNGSVLRRGGWVSRGLWVSRLPAGCTHITFNVNLLETVTVHDGIMMVPIAHPHLSYPCASTRKQAPTLRSP